ncbi:MAG: DNA repair protein RecN [Clostridia bacterium]|nr:DNA repair protein RecN [Clostridia bacterium]
MLNTLHIENIAVVKSVDIELSPGFTVFTGETGAGKSIIVDSISLLLGGKFRPDMLRTGENTATVCGYFTDISDENLRALEKIGVPSDEEGGLYVQRDFTSDGKTHTRINGRTVPVSLLRSATGLLVNIHGQHDNQKLLDPRSHGSLLDAWAEDGDLLAEYRGYYDKVREIRQKIAAASVSEAEKERRSEMLKFQIEEIFSVKLAPGDEEELEQRRLLLRDIEKTKKHTQIIYRALYRNEKGTSAGGLLEMAQTSLEAISDVLPEAEGFAERLDAIRSELEDIAERSAAVTEGVSGDPAKELNEVESRLAKIRRLQKKYGTTVEEILEFGENAKRELDELEGSDLLVKELNKQLGAETEKAVSASEKLYKAREKAASDLEKLICKQLAFLDMNSAEFKVDIRHDPDDLLPDGCDRIEFLLSANQGETAKPLALIASGGELARIMLGIKSVFAEKEGTQTLIYDEIDTGISGKTSQKLGLVLKSCAASAQVLCVTHSAQIAAAADNHLLVAKTAHGGRTTSEVREITGDERINEVARIMGGNTITEKLRESAVDLINETK